VRYTITKKPILKETTIIESYIEDTFVIEDLKKKIDEKIGALSYKTNVRAEMTDWKDFLKEESFKRIMHQNAGLWQSQFKNITSYYLKDAWGNKLKQNDFVVEHSHEPSVLSGIIYLTNKGPGTYFPEIDSLIKEEIGKVVLFQSYLKHSVSEFTFDEFRYTISFNLDLLDRSDEEVNKKFEEVNKKYGNN